MKLNKKQIWLTAGLGAVIAVLLVLTYQYHIHAPLKGMKIHLNDEEVYSFLQKEDIERLFIHEKNIHVNQLSIETADLEQLESIALAHPWVATANMYIDNSRYLNIDVTQRIPIARVFDQAQKSYYIDSTNSIMPVVVGFSYPALVFTNIPNTKDSAKMQQYRAEIIQLAKLINADTFWSKQIVQIAYAGNGKYEMATLLGNQKIVLGDTQDVSIKLDNLMAFYKQVSNQLGWDKYKEINISFTNQVVASPSLGWVPPKPVDTVIKVPEELKVDELIQTLPERPMEEAKGIQKEEIPPVKPSVDVQQKNKASDSLKVVKDSTKIV